MDLDAVYRFCDNGLLRLEIVREHVKPGERTGRQKTGDEQKPEKTWHFGSIAPSCYVSAGDGAIMTPNWLRGQ